MSKRVQIYHPTKTVKGFACSFWQSHQFDLFATLMKQSGWDEANQNGTFKGSLEDPTKRVNIKLSQIEAAGILNCLDRNRPFSSFHTNDKGDAPKQINFAPWMYTPVSDDDGPKAAPIQKGYSFSITIGNKNDPQKNSFYIGLSYDEGRLIREYIMWHLATSFSAPYAGKQAESAAADDNSVNTIVENESIPLVNI